MLFRQVDRLVRLAGDDQRRFDRANCGKWPARSTLTLILYRCDSILFAPIEAIGNWRRWRLAIAAWSHTFTSHHLHHLHSIAVVGWILGKALTVTRGQLGNRKVRIFRVAPTSGIRWGRGSIHTTFNNVSCGIEQILYSLSGNCLVAEFFLQ